jgi:phosphoenolpyruvate carboxylase
MLVSWLMNRCASGVFGMVVEEFKRSKRVVSRLTGQTKLLEKNPVLARSIRLP